MDVERLAWRTSSFSGGENGNGGCVEVAPLPDGVAVRDTKDRSRAPHTYTRQPGSPCSPQYAPATSPPDARAGPAEVVINAKSRPPAAQGTRTSTHTLWWSEVSFSRASGSLATGQNTRSRRPAAEPTVRRSRRGGCPARGR